MKDFPNDHPFSIYNKNLYIDSGTWEMPIYIFKFGNKGVLVECHLNDTINGPHCRLYDVDFPDDYDFKLVRTFTELFASSTNDLFLKAVAAIERRIRSNGE